MHGPNWFQVCAEPHPKKTSCCSDPSMCQVVMELFSAGLRGTLTKSKEETHSFWASAHPVWNRFCFNENCPKLKQTLSRNELSRGPNDCNKLKNHMNRHGASSACAEPQVCITEQQKIVAQIQRQTRLWIKHVWSSLGLFWEVSWQTSFFNCPNLFWQRSHKN